MNLRQFNLNLLVALQALLNQRNVTRAAAQVGLTQSAMSGELRHLRKMFGDELLVRVGREYVLTPFARDLVEPVNQIIAGIEHTLAHRPSFDPSSEERHFSIAMSDYAILMLLDPLLQHTIEHAPGVTLHVHPLQEDATPGMLRPGGMDIVITPRGVASEGVHCQPLWSDRFVCVVRADHPEVGERLTPEQFERLPRVAFGLGSVLGASTAERHYETMGVRGHVVVTTESFALAPFLLSRTPLIAVVQERLALRFREAAGIKIVEPPFTAPPLEEAMYWSTVVEMDPAHAWLRSRIIEIARGV